MALLSIQLCKSNIQKSSLKLSSLLLPKYNPLTCSVGCNLQILFGSLHFSSSLLLPLWSRIPLPELEQWPPKCSICSHSAHWSQHDLCHSEAFYDLMLKALEGGGTCLAMHFHLAALSFVLWTGSTKSFKKFP